MTVIELAPVVSRRIDFMLTVVGLAQGPRIDHQGNLCPTCDRRYPTAERDAHWLSPEHLGTLEARRILRVQREVSRFWSEVNREGPVPEFAPHLGPCWIWTGPVFEPHPGHPYGNARTYIRGERFAHRVAFTLAGGPLLGGLQLDHLCRVTLCVNPLHLEPVTCKENVRRGKNGVLRHLHVTTTRPAPTHCQRGHERVAENLYRNGACRPCDQIRTARYRANRPTFAPVKGTQEGMAL